MIKRFCDQIGKPYLPLRTSSVTSLLAGLTALGRETAPQPAAPTRTLQ